MAQDTLIQSSLARFEAAFAAFAARRFSGDDRLAQAVRYALLGRGKRVRPLMAVLGCYAVSGAAEPALGAAIALELIHTYSLVHDDLPLMDDDSFRRGRPTVHVEFDPATALLVGDALLTEAFRVLSEDLPEAPMANSLRADAKLKMVAVVAAAAGGHGMVLGQMQDLYWTGRGGATRSDLDQIHSLKTGCLLKAAAACGALAGGGDAAATQLLERIGATTGHAFQIRDDIIDSLGGTGKSQGKDAAQGKLTYLSSMTAEAAQQEVDRLTQEAVADAATFGPHAAPLIALITALIARTA